MDNLLRIQEDNFHLTIYLDKLHDLPRANYRRLLRLLRRHPDAMELLGAYLREQAPVYRAAWKARNQEFVNGWRNADAIRAEIRAENARLERSMLSAKRLYETYNRLLQIYESQGGIHS